MVRLVGQQRVPEAETHAPIKDEIIMICSETGQAAREAPRRVRQHGVDKTPLHQTQSRFPCFESA